MGFGLTIACVFWKNIRACCPTGGGGGSNTTVVMPGAAAPAAAPGTPAPRPAGPPQGQGVNPQNWWDHFSNFWRQPPGGWLGQWPPWGQPTPRPRPILDHGEEDYELGPMMTPGFPNRQAEYRRRRARMSNQDEWRGPLSTSTPRRMNPVERAAREQMDRLSARGNRPGRVRFDENEEETSFLIANRRQWESDPELQTWHDSSVYPNLSHIAPDVLTYDRDIRRLDHSAAVDEEASRYLRQRREQHFNTPAPRPPLSHYAAANMTENQLAHNESERDDDPVLNVSGAGSLAHQQAINSSANNNSNQQRRHRRSQSVSLNEEEAANLSSHSRHMNNSGQANSSQANAQRRRYRGEDEEEG